MIVVADATLNYTKLPGAIGRRRVRLRIFSILVIAFGILTFLNCSLIEYLNYRAGSVLPFAPLPPDMHDTWRMGPTGERSYRTLKLQDTGDPSWESRPLTPVEEADFQAWRKPRVAWNDLGEAVSYACFLIPLIPIVLVGTLVLLIYQHSLRWRIALAAVGLLQLAAIGMFFHLSLMDAISRTMP